jgi:hypothetical protein
MRSQCLDRKLVSALFYVTESVCVESHVSSQFRNVWIANRGKYLTSTFWCYCISRLLAVTSIVTIDGVYYVIKHTTDYVTFSFNSFNIN